MKEILAILGLKAKATVADAVAAIKALFKEIEDLKSSEALKTISDAKDAAEERVHELEGKLDEGAQMISVLEAKLHDLVINVTGEKKYLTDGEIDDLSKDFQKKNPSIKEFWITADGEVYIIAEMARKHGAQIGAPNVYQFENE